MPAARRRICESAPPSGPHRSNIFILIHPLTFALRKRTSLLSSKIIHDNENNVCFRKIYLCFIDLEIVNTRVHNYFLAQYGFVAS